MATVKIFDGSNWTSKFKIYDGDNWKSLSVFDKSNWVASLLAPLSDFAVSEIQSNTSTSLSFYDQSENSPTSWSWDFGDGNTSSEQNPTHTYASEGVYTVELTVTNDEGSDTETKVDYIDIGPIPTAAFSTTETVINVGTTISFSNESTGEKIEGYVWDFGDGDYSTETNPSHIYNSEGLRTVELVVQSAYGEDTETKVDYIDVGYAPVAEFTVDTQSADTSTAIQFTDQSTNSPTGWSWDFGDGNTSSQQNPSHTYSSGGTYTVTLTATNKYGETTETKTDYITIESTGTEPTANFSADKTETDTSTSVQFTDESTDPTSWTWDFGDGNQSTQQSPTHTYTSVGVYTVELTVTNSSGSDSKQKLNLVWVGDILVVNPGNNNSIKNNLESAFASASSGDTIQLPAGEFTVEDGTNNTIFLSNTTKDNILLRGTGKGTDGTKLYRSEVIQYDKMIGIQIDNHIEISDIWFQGPKPRLYEGDTGYALEDIHGIAIGNTNVYLHDCKFSWFSGYMISIDVRPYTGFNFNSVVSNNEFIENYWVDDNGIADGGSCVSVGRMESGDTIWEDVEPGDSTFVFIEDNYFSQQNCPVVGGHGGLYVFRHNYVERNVAYSILNMHGGSFPDGHPPTRLVEVYENTFIANDPDNPSYGDPDSGILGSFGGEAVVHNNVMDGLSQGAQIKVGDFWFDDSYPFEGWQAGYESGVQYGANHTGTDPSTYGAGDWFIWDNTYKNMEGAPKLRVVQDPDSTYFKEGRDYHFDKAHPGYIPYQYPHPMRGLPEKETVKVDTTATGAVNLKVKVNNGKASATF